MPSNIEVKLQVDDLQKVTQEASALADHGPESLVQEDIYFQAPHGRLKLRKFPNAPAELIAYDRPDDASVRESRWLRYATTCPKDLQAVLTMAIGDGVTIRKQRTLYLIGQTRIHLDQVESLGSFVELEVVLTENQSPTEGTMIANALIQKLGLETATRIEVSYADLLSASR